MIGNILMSSIMSGRDPETGTMPPELDAQVVNIFKQIKLCVEAAGGTLDDILKVNFWMKDPATGRKALNGEWSKMFPDPESRPARHTLVAPGERAQPRDLRLRRRDRPSARNRLNDVESRSTSPPRQPEVRDRGADEGLRLGRVADAEACVRDSRRRCASPARGRPRSRRRRAAAAGTGRSRCSDRRRRSRSWCDRLRPPSG